MSKFITEQDYISAYEHKKKQAEARLIPFEFTLEEYKVLLRLKWHLGKCAYTNQKFHDGGGHKHTPTLERIDENKPYCKENTVWCTAQSNLLKNNHLELSKPMTNLTPDEISIVHRIKKVLSTELGYDKIMQPYKEAYKQLEQKQKDSHSERMKELEEQSIKLEQQAAEKAAQEQYEQRFKNEQELAKHYLLMVEEFAKLDLLYELTIKEHRDQIRRTSCAISGEKFKEGETKWVWVKDKTKPITKNNLVVCKKEVQQSLDFLSANANMKTCLGNLVKIL